MSPPASSSVADERLAWLALGLAEGVGARTQAQLLEVFDSAHAVCRASPRELATVVGPTRGRRIHEALRRTRPNTLAATAEDRGQTLLTPADADWPRAWFEGMHEPPPWLFVQGELPPDRSSGELSPDERGPPVYAVAIVGTRGASHGSLEQARRLAHDLAVEGCWIISGLALGIDGAAHTGALGAPGGRTLAVLGSALDQLAPLEHAGLAADIREAGALVSEHPPGTPPSRWSFPRRNRLIAAWSELVIVIEAPSKSGALLTARFALEQGRETAVVPGSPRGGRHRGGHLLLKQGAAHLVESARDVTELLGIDRKASAAADAAAPPSLPDGTPTLVWRLLDADEPATVDALADRTGLGAARLGPALVELELLERAQQIPGQGWIRR